MKLNFTSFRLICGAALFVAAGATSAATDASAQARYQQDRDACMTGNTQQAKEVCLREAGAARDAAQKGALTQKPGTDTASNATERCDVFKKADEHAACLDRIQGAGNTQGSPLKGGVLRESVTTTTTTTQPK